VVNALLQNPKTSLVPAFLKHICISSEKQNSKSFQATAVILGSLKGWQLREMKNPLFPPTQISLPDWPQSLTQTTLGARQLGLFFPLSLLTIPQNSQAIPRKTWLVDFALWVNSVIASSVQQSLLIK
jgi:hypothetical protein